MEEIRTPPRLHSLNPTKVQIIQHISKDSRKTFECEDIFPFETIFNLKQRITLEHVKSGDAKYWLPSQVFLAEEKNGKYIPLEFEWDFQKTVQDPYDPSVLGKPVRELYENGERMPTVPTLFSGILLETKTDAKTIHAWNIYDVAKAAGFRPQDEIREELLFGFLHLYFPMISSTIEFAQIDNPIDPEILEIVESHRGYVSERYQKLESILKSEEMPQTNLTDLLDIHYILPKKDRYERGFLELRFYEMEPTVSAPFIRFFPANVREMPIVKLASSNGFSVIENKKLLHKLMDDQPSTKLGAVILIKAPVIHPDAPLGTTWTIRVFEDGNAELVIGAPRKNQPLLAPVLAEAFRMLKPLLESTPWLDTSQLQLSQISAVYKCKSQIESKPSKEELLARLDPFLPLFFVEKGLDPTAQLSLRYKAVSNYVRDTDPIVDYIANLYLRDSATSADPKVFQSYVLELIKEFGISKREAEKEVEAWVTNHSEQMVVGSKAVLGRNIGSAISIYNDHPNYRFLVTGVGSHKDLTRILTLLTILVSQKKESLQIAETKKERKEVEKVIEEVEKEVSQKAEPEEEEEGEWSFSMAARLPHANDDDEEEEEEEEEQKNQTKEQETSKEKTTELKLTDTLPALSDEWYLDNLKETNSSLFSYTDSPKPYSRICQASSGKQPNVMDTATYKRAKLFYKSDVFWIVSPLTQRQMFLLQFVSKTPSERMKMKLGGTLDELGATFDEKKEKEKMRREFRIKAEKDALRLGFPLKKGESIADKPDSEVPKSDADEIKELIKQQENKPLWIVVRAGTEKANYYICAELWCIRDNLPIIPYEFEGTVSRRKDDNGKPLKKSSNSCPICGGSIIQNYSNPLPGETIVQRRKTSSSKIQKYAGFAKVIHPSGYVLPCCFADPNNQDYSEDAKPPPPSDIDEKEPEPEPEPDAEPEAKSPGKKTVAAERENANRPFSPTKKGLSSQNEWYIPNQNILGRIVDRWLFLDKGSVAVPSKAVNKLIGQDPEQFLSKKGGILQGSINSLLTVPGNAFVQYGLGNSVRQPGNNLLSFIAYAKYATSYTFLQDDSLAIGSTDSILSMMFEEKPIEMFYAFQSANYGTLVHEFSTPQKSLRTVEQKRVASQRKPATFQEWLGSVTYTQPTKELDSKQRPYFENMFIAWDNFEEYVRDKEAVKDLRLWEGLFTVKGLLTDTGFILVKIIVPKNPNDEARIECPMFGVSLANQKDKLPLLFVLQDSVSGLYDPLVVYEGKIGDKKEEIKILLGVISETVPIMARGLSPNVREPLKTFIQEYYGNGCGRITSPIHPWMPVRSSKYPIPRLSEYVNVLERSKEKKDESLFSELRALVRDRSHRLVGVLVQYIPKPSKESGPFFIPCLDDGCSVSLPSIYGEDAIPLPTFTDLLDFLTGRNKHDGSWSKHKWAHHFKGLDYRQLITNQVETVDAAGAKTYVKYYVGIDLECGVTIPIKKIQASNINFKEIFETYFSDDKRMAERFLKSKTLATMHGDMPWDDDKKILGEADASVKGLGQTDEEILEESYQHLRITISNWLNDTKSNGVETKKRIEELRQARKRLPMFELQKRLEILLMPRVKKYLTTEGKVGHFMLRKDCSKQEEEGCTGGCVWIGPKQGGECLIHTTKTERYKDPLYVLTARLVDELLRSFGLAQEILNQGVSYLKPLSKDQLQQEGDTLLFSAFGKGEESLYEKLGYSRRRPGKFTQALTYPEEVSIDEITLSSPKYIPEGWDFTMPTFGSDVRDSYAKFLVSLVQLTGKDITELEKAIGKITNTKENWKAIGNLVGANVIFTKLKLTTLSPADVFDIGSKLYILLSDTGLPLKHISGAYIVESKQLPKSIQSWLTGSNSLEEEKPNSKEPEPEQEQEPEPKKPEPEAKQLTFKLETTNTIEAIDATIETLYADLYGAESDMTKQSGDLKKNFKNKDYYRMHSSSSQFDCLIHTLLTSMSTNFRRLPQAKKDEFAHYFRLSIYPEIVESLGKTSAQITKRVQSKVFLLDEDLLHICKFYKLNMLVFEDEKSELVKGLHDGPRIKMKMVTMPHCIAFHEESADDVYMIYNNGAHFEAVRSKEGYLITKDKATAIYSSNKCDTGVQEVQCVFGEGDTVQYKGAPHYVIWRTSNEEGSCEEYGLTDKKERLEQFLEMPQKERDKTKVLKEFGSIVVKASELK